MPQHLNNEIFEVGQIITLNRSENKKYGNMGYGELKEYYGKHSGNIQVWSLWWSYNNRENVFGFREPEPIKQIQEK